MKQGNSVLLLTLAFCLCVALLTGCLPTPEPVQYGVAIAEDIQHGSVECEVTSAVEGQVITLTAKADENYQLVAFTVNGEAIESIYDLQGRKIEKVTKGGIYIVNGKKVLVK